MPMKLVEELHACTSRVLSIKLYLLDMLSKNLRPSILRVCASGAQIICLDARILYSVEEFLIGLRAVSLHLVWGIP